jgi:ACS family glucarate transporter-like MFS transporter
VAADASAGSRPTILRHVVLACLLVIATINYIQRNSMSTAEKTIRDEWGATLEQTGDALSAFFLGYTLMQIPSGWVAQRLGARAALTFFAAAWSAMTGLCALAHGVYDLYAARLLLGVFQAGMLPCCTLILADWYPRSRRGLATALLNSSMLIGGALSLSLTGLLLGTLGWRLLFAAYMLPGLVWAAWFGWWFRNRPQDHPQVNRAEMDVIAEAEDREKTAALASSLTPVRRIPWAVILLNLLLVLICAQQACRAGASRFYDTYLPTYYQEQRGTSVKLAGLLAGVPLVAGVAGGLVGGALSDTVLRRSGSRSAARKGVAIAGLLSGTFCFGVSFFINDVWLFTLVFSLGAFLTTFASPCAFALTMDVAGANLAVVFGTMNMAGNLGAYLFVWSVPRLVTLGGWGLALVVFAALHLFAALCWLFLQPDQTIGEPAKQI